MIKANWLVYSLVSNADIQIYNLHSKQWETIIQNGGYNGSLDGNVEKDYKHQNGYRVYLVLCFFIGIAWTYSLLSGILWNKITA